MYKLLMIMFLLVLGTAASAQVEDMKAAKKGAFLAAKKMNEALINKDFGVYANFNHPKVIKEAKGGRDGLIFQMQTQIANNENHGNYISAIYPGQPSDIIDTAGEWQCTIPLYMEVKVPNAKVSTQTTLVGISMNKGQDWYFIDVANAGGVDGLKPSFPTLSSKLYAPPAPEAKVTQDPPSNNK